MLKTISVPQFYKIKNLHFRYSEGVFVSFIGVNPVPLKDNYCSHGF